MKKYYVASDIHGFFSEWMMALKDNGFDENNQEHIIILCGDIIDRGNESEKIINFLYDFPKERRILIYGNHEELFLDMIYRGYPRGHDMTNGTYNTYKDLFKTDQIMSIEEFEKSKLCKLIEQTIDYYETKNYIFVHSWIPQDYLGYYNEYWNQGTSDLWHRARWCDSIKEYFKNMNKTGKTIVSGHMFSAMAYLYEEIGEKAFLEYLNNYEKYSHLNKIYYGDKYINLDCNTYTSKIVQILVLTEEDLNG